MPSSSSLRRTERLASTLLLVASSSSPLLLCRGIRAVASSSPSPPPPLPRRRALLSSFIALPQQSAGLIRRRRGDGKRYFCGTRPTSSTSFSASWCIIRMSSSQRKLHNDDADDVAASPPPLPSLSSSSSTSELQISSRTLLTLDPCVILMKQIISQHASKWENDPRGIYSLAQGVVHWRPPRSAYEALESAVRSNMLEFENDDGGQCGMGMDGATAGGDSGDGRIIHTYCPDEGYPPLLAALKEKLQRENGLTDPHVMVTSGANQAFVNCVLTLLDEVDGRGNVSKCVVFEPYYFNHVMAVQGARGGRGCGGTAASAAPSAALTDAKSVEGLLVGPTSKGVPDLKWLRSQLERNRYDENDNNGSSGGNAIRMVTLVNPGNPTGVALPHDFILEMAQLTKEFGAWLVVDNTYEHFDVAGKNRLPHAVVDSDAPDFPCLDTEHVINIFSFSKGYAMAGFRVGYVALSSRKKNDGESAGAGTRAYEEMLKVQDTVAICASRLSQMAALGALLAGREWVHKRVKTLDEGRAAILDAMSPLEEIIGGDGAMYVMGKLPDGVDDQAFASSLVERHGVAVIPGSFCGLPGWIRVCYSNLPPDDCKVAADRLRNGILGLVAAK